MFNNMLVDFYNSLFVPKKLLNSEKGSILIPFIIMGVYLISPNMNLKKLFLIFSLSFLSSGLRILFAKKYAYYSYLASSSTLLLFALNFYSISFFWNILLKTYIDIKEKNFYSFIIGTFFDIFLFWWLI
ncbi:hypothetical protein OSSY52_07300 [Tepiditoga spiralis]|uniref:Uncharacterized protein n=1 Tax=Tepiditoga spiralis TaxID=2108365 RepID=A0A7G1GAP7_9BACT|nr:hypothetical protein [Tepiditoga spiralis]BBE30589.1 hypothetical protein OSSY52_07300 [Tepiditoga spiralis]